jgi:GNAT superfamily N-acetyltransferase
LSDFESICEMLTSENWHNAARDLEGGDTAWHILVAVIDRKVVGFLEGTFKQEFSQDWRLPEHVGQQAWIFQLLVHSAYRRTGVGSQIVQKFASEAQAEGCTHVGLMVNPNKPTLTRESFFTSLGFVHVLETDPTIAVCRLGDLTVSR